MESITIEFGDCILTLSDDDVSKLYYDNILLQDAILSLINPEVADNSDLSIESKEAKKLLYQYFSKNKNYNQDFIQKIFKNIL